MNKFLSFIATMPMFTYAVATLIHFLTHDDFYINYHWFIVAFISFQVMPERLVNIHSLNVMILISGIIANLLLVSAAAFDLIITPITFLIFVGYLSLGISLLFINLAVNKYQKLSINSAKV